ncbi:MAG TPA: DUF998 domain-containing protein [Acidimicrobiales bacterium]|nr:DUF998 domain-containing protein [Acidimicrobiales bacterium]
MVLRSGYRKGPARPWDVAAALAGVGLVLILLAFVVAAGSRPGYSQMQDTISRLGAIGASGQGWFTAVNLIDALLIAVFAYGVSGSVPDRVSLQ